MTIVEVDYSPSQNELTYLFHKVWWEQPVWGNAGPKHAVINSLLGACFHVGIILNHIHWFLLFSNNSAFLSSTYKTFST